MNRSPRLSPHLLRCALETLETRRLLAAGFNDDDDGDKGSRNQQDGLSITWFPQTVMLRADGGLLTARQTGRRADLAREFIANNAEAFGLTVADVRASVITDQYTDAKTGNTHVYFQQQLNGLAIQNTSLGVHFASDGRVITANSSFVPNLADVAAGAARASVSGMLHPTLALRAAATALEVAFPAAKPDIIAGDAPNTYSILSPGLSADPIPVEPQYIASEDGVSLSWKIVMRLSDGSGDWYDLSVDAQTGEILFADNWKHDLASYNVFPAPVESPAHGTRQIVVDPQDPLASPFGWHDTDGVAGAESTLTLGNNVSAQDDIDNNNSGGLRPDGGASLNFDFPLDLAQAPSAYRPAAITNLFYWNNILHDVHYKYGFTENAGNFQTNNYGRGGAGNDAVQADAQDGGGTDNANFATPPDGSPGRMQMYIFTSPTPDRDGDLDSGIIAHEYGHGVSNRLTGGPANASALASTQSGGMGEGWSDFYALMLTQVATDQPGGIYPMGTYVLDQSNTGTGIRRRPYSFDQSINPLTFEAYGSGGSTPYGISKSTQVHNSGELWASALWDLNWLLIAKTGFDANLLTGYDANGTTAERAGNKLALQLVMDGMKLQPANPSFVQARDAIFAADQALTGGANTREIWLAFARRGLGVGASTSGASSSTVVTSFDVPAALFDPLVMSATPTGGTQLQPLSSFSFTFNEPIDPASVSIVDDVQSFTGPGGANLKATITGATFSNSNKTVTIQYSGGTTVGTYAMTLGPAILAVDNSAPMDQNLNGFAGESGDTFTTSYTLQRTIGPDAVGYTAGQYPFQNINLVAGQPGVVSLVNGTDDGNAQLNLPAGKWFNFYGVNYTGMSVSANGLISFNGTATTGVGNGDFTTSPTLASIGTLYDDWRTDTNLGAGDSAVLYSIDNTTNTLTIEWSEVVNYNAGGAGTSNATFQVILQLNTVGAPGRIINNYTDIDVGSALFTDGASASVGIKDANTQGARRLLISANTNANPWVKTGRANILGLDVIAPTAVGDYLPDVASSLRFAFDEPVAAVPAGAVTLDNLTTGQPIALPAATYDSGANTLDFALANLLPDGNYRATARGALTGPSIADIAGNPLDGNADGVATGDYAYSFFALAGDATRDRSVTLDDFTVLAANFGQTGRVFTEGDFNYSPDGVVNLDDFTILAAQFGKTLPPAASIAARASAGSPIEPGLALAARRPESPFAGTRLIDDLFAGV